MTNGCLCINLVLSPQPRSMDGELLDRLSPAGRAIAQEVTATFKPHFTVFVAPRISASYDDRRGDRPMTTDIFLGIKPNSVAPGPHEGQDRWLWSKQETFVFTDDFTFWGTYSPSGSSILLTRFSAQKRNSRLSLSFCRTGLSRSATASPLFCVCKRLQPFHQP
jgi:hypothetical protein